MMNDAISNILSFNYKLDDFQKNSAEAILNNENVCVTSHTGAGKTTVGLIGIANALSKNQRIIYTTPIKSLSNQKFSELKKKFPKFSVGIMTGDIKIDPEADIVVMTQEILYLMVLTKEFKESNVGCIVIDEFHYINDAERGKIYEQALTFIPDSVNVILLSATIDCTHIKNWLDTKSEKKYKFFGTSKRPVPLYHYVFHNDKKIKFFDSIHNFNDQAYKSIKSEFEKNDRDKKFISKEKQLQNFIRHLQEHKELPCLFFVFSRKQTEKIANSINLQLIDGKTANHAIELFDYYTKKFFGENGFQLNQYWSLRKLIEKGMCFHHSGLFPVFKEIIEILFEKKLIKLLLVTETMACGINMPCKTVVFSSLTKYDGKLQRNLVPAEYTQIAGRAGRRGIDTKGNIYYFPMRNMLSVSETIYILSGKYEKIRSKYQINPIEILRLIGEKKDVYNVLEKSLLKFETDSVSNGILQEIELLKENRITIEISDENSEKIENLIKLENLIKTPMKPKKKNIIRNEIKNLRESIDDFLIENFRKNQKFNQDLKKLEKQLQENKEYIKNEIDFMIETLKKYEYIDKTNQLTRNGLAVITMNSFDAFSFIEFLPNILYEQDMKIFENCLIFSLGMMIDDKDLNDEDKYHINDTIKYISEVLEEDELKYIDIIGKKMKLQMKIHDSFVSQGRTFDNFRLTPNFSLLLKLWVRDDITYNSLCAMNLFDEIFEGNFVKNILKLYNILEEIIRVFEIYEISKEKIEIVKKIQTKLIKDTVVIDSIYL